MSNSKIILAVKDYWPWIVGGVVGLYVIYHYNGSNNSAQPSGVSLAGLMAAQAASANQAAAIQSQSQIANAQIAAQDRANQLQAAIQYNQSLASAAQGVGSALSTIIAAQSAIPVAAINAASAENQAALTSAAATAVSSMQAASSAVSSTGTNLAQIGAATANIGFATAQNTLANSTMANSYIDSLGKFGKNITDSVNSLNKTTSQIGLAPANMALGYRQKANDTLGLTAIAPLGLNAQMLPSLLSGSGNTANTAIQANTANNQSNNNLWGSVISTIAIAALL